MKKLKYLSIPMSIVFNTLLLFQIFGTNDSFSVSDFNIVIKFGNYLYREFAYNNAYSQYSAGWQFWVGLCLFIFAMTIFTVAAVAVTIFAVQHTTALLKRLPAKNRAVVISVWAAFSLAASMLLYGYNITHTNFYDIYLFAYFASISCLLLAAASSAILLFSFWKRKHEKSCKIFCIIFGCLASVTALLTAVIFIRFIAISFRDFASSFRHVYYFVVIGAVIMLAICGVTTAGMFQKRLNKNWLKACAAFMLASALILPVFAGATQYPAYIGKCFYDDGETIEAFYNPADLMAMHIAIIKLGLSGDDVSTVRSFGSGIRIGVSKTHGMWHTEPESYGDIWDRVIDDVPCHVVGFDYYGFHVYVFEPTVQ